MAPSPVGGLTVSDELRTLSRRPGFLSSCQGGQRMRDLYRQESLRFNPTKLCEFGLACYIGSSESVKELVERGEAPDIESTVTAYRWSWLTIVIAGSQRVRSIRPANRTAGNKYHEPEHESTLRYLISKGAPLDLQDIAGYTALHHATIATSVPRLARVLLEAGANPDLQDKYGSPPVSGASLSKQIEAVDVLMEYGARLDLRDADDFCLAEKYTVFGPEVAAVIHKWIRKREGKEAPLEGKSCDYCGKVAGGDVKLSYCSRCKLARYDSRECQVNHWKTHKLTCRHPDMENTITLKPFYDGHLTPISRADLTNSVMGISTKTAKELHEDTPSRTSKPKHRTPMQPDNKEASRMVIKVQVPIQDFTTQNPLLSGDCLVYNKKRDFMCLIRQAENPENFAKLVQVVTSKGVGGLKAYLRAELKSRYELEVRIDEVLAEQMF
ncbi:hypothetical protein FRC03_012329 [Tulasnella sp. 419]|nr:hypothetical protein FRC03_012329 [Tulasnella sp. 419]